MCSAGTAAVTLQAAPAYYGGALMLTWRCRNLICRRIIQTFGTYSGDYQEHRCACKTWNILPRDRSLMVREIPKCRPERSGGRF